MNAAPHNRFKYFILTILFVCCLMAPVYAQQLEYELKAEFIERFTRFIEWPNASLEKANGNFEICIAGNSPLEDYLERISTQFKIKGRSALVREVSAKDIPGTCHVLFIPKSEEKQLSALLSACSGEALLTISDSPGFAEQGVLINFYKAEQFVRFEINVAAVQKSRLKFSSRLLKLAKLVDTAERAIEGGERP